MNSTTNIVSDPNNSCHLQKALCDAICSYDSHTLRNLLDDDYPATFIDTENQSLLHLACKSILFHDEQFDKKSNNSQNSSRLCSIIYMLIDAGINPELRDRNGNTCLSYAVKSRNIRLCDVLLQCGADMWAMTDSGEYLFDYIIGTEDEDLKIVFQKFYPGLWKAVESEDIYQVRKLINLWCKTDLHRDGCSLKDKAFDVGNEGIISLVLGIFESMKMVYHILAKNTKAVSRMLQTSRKQLRLDLRKMSERGAPILYYLIQSRDVPIIKLFISEGCHIYTVMLDEHGFDMPVLFTALEPDIPLDVIEALLPKNKKHQEEILYKILYKGKTILEVAFGNNVSLEVFSAVVDRGGPLLISDRNEFNQTVKDLAVLNDKKLYAEVIDKHVLSWISQPLTYPFRRQSLALYGWVFNNVAQKHYETLSQQNKDLQEFLLHLNDYQSQIAQLAEAVEMGDAEKFDELKVFSSSCDIFERNLAWHGKVVGDGLPLLHRAVLFNHPRLVELILNEKPANESIDKLFDQHHRTALHYAYARCSTSLIRKMLLDNGCSEHVLDKLNKEPLDFREQQDSSLLMELLDRLKFKNTASPEPNPWNNVEKEIFLADVPCHQLWGKSSERCLVSYAFDENSSYDDQSESSDENVQAVNHRAFCFII